MDFKKFLAFLACPYCKSDLEFISNDREGSFNCRDCENEFPIVDGIPRFLKVNEEILGKAKTHWESSPNFQYEAKAELYSREYYEEQDRWRACDVDPFCMHEYQFDDVKGKVVLDIGCGSGWVLKQAAKNRALVIGVDFAEKSVISTREALRHYNLEGLVIQGDAQFLPIKTDVIDRVYSIGVLHHIPDTEKGVEEARRIVKPGGTGLISLYGKLFFFNPVLFPVATFFLRLLLKAPPERNGIQNTRNYDEFYRFMDGSTNPIGRWYSDGELKELFRNFEILSSSKSHFPLRYLKIGKICLIDIVPRFMHKFLNDNFGMMRLTQLKKRRETVS